MKRFPVLLVWFCAFTFLCAAGEPEFSLRQESLVEARVVGDGWLCVVVDPTAQILALRDADVAARAEIAKARADRDSGKNLWFYDKAILYHTLQVAVPVRTSLARRHGQPGTWMVNGRVPKQATFFPYAIDGFPREHAEFLAPGEGMPMPRTVDYVYLNIGESFRDGQAYEVKHADGPSLKIVFDSRQTTCWALKVNQLGYLPGGSKFAYLGMWLGFGGPADFRAQEGKPFFVHRFENGQAAGELVLAGKIRLEVAADSATPATAKNFAGENVYGLDLSSLKDPGQYCIVVPGLGRSWPFVVDAAVFGDAFFHVARAMYHQRGTIALGEPNTAWLRPEIKRPVYRGGFLPDTDRYYAADYAKGTPPAARIGFRDEQGKPVSISHFSMVQGTATTEPFPGLEGGGWHDAADFDRSSAHYDCVWDFLGACELFPGRFADSQWNLPESGNGVPDVLDEAAVMVDLFMRTQNAAGGVSGWMEQTGHPGRLAQEDPKPYYLSLPDRTGSLRFAAAAAYLGRLIEPFDPARAKRYVDSAARAFAFGIDEKHRIAGIKFTVPPDARDVALRGKTLTFNERQELPLIQGAKFSLPRLLAAIQLFAATGRPDYREEIRAGKFSDTALQALPGAIPPFAFVTPLLRDDILSPAEKSQVLARLREEAAESMAGSAILPYRMLWRAPDHRYFSHMSWGAVHGPRVARWHVLLWRLTGEPAYREAMLRAVDWELGCNPMGRSLTTGLGSVFPIVLQHHQSYYDGILEPVPGISPYTFTYGAAFQTWNQQIASIDAGHGSVKAFFKPVAVCYLPETLGRGRLQAELDKRRDSGAGDWPQKAAVLMRDQIGGEIPTMRRLYIHPHEAPAQNEFTVGESISSHLPVYAALLPDGWKPGAAQLKRQPRPGKNLVFYPQP